MKELRNLVDGRVQPAASGATLESVAPASGESWARIPRSDATDVDDAVAAAQRAFPAWAALAPAARGHQLEQVAAVVDAHADELAELEARDNGRVIRDVRSGDLPGVAYMFRAAAADAPRAIEGRALALGPTSLGFTRREPLGVVAGIIPWNAPLPTFAGKAAPALAAGNCVVIKPAEEASVAVLRLAELLAGVLPAGVLQVVAGLGEEAGDALVRHPGVARVSLTGSSETGRIVTRASADTLKRLAFELGGKSPNIVFADADLDAAAVGVSTLSIYTGNAGQVCIAGSRILAHESIHDALLARVREIVARDVKLGDPLDPATTMGPIVSERQFERVTGYLEVARKEGEILFGGRSGAALFPAGSPLARGYFVEPTLVGVKTNRLRICQEEIFGPVATLMPFSDEAEAVALANDSPYGLAAGVWTRDLGTAQRMLRDLACGTVWVNTYRRYGGGLALEGQKDSGYGHDGILESTREKACLIELP